VIGTSRSHSVERRVEAVELAVARLLRVGVSIAAVLIAAGLGAMLVGLSAVASTRMVTAGLIVLVITPIMRVVAALIVYFRERDVIYTLISLFVLVMLGIGLLIGRMD